MYAVPLRSLAETAGTDPLPAYDPDRVILVFPDDFGDEKREEIAAALGLAPLEGSDRLFMLIDSDSSVEEILRTAETDYPDIRVYMNYRYRPL
jgi:hypothetical protein